MPPHARSAAGYNEHHDEDDLEEDMQGERGHTWPIETLAPPALRWNWEGTKMGTVSKDLTTFSEGLWV